MPLDFNKPWYKRHSDDEWFDEFRIEGNDAPILRAIIVPRYKTSDLSGDEWRISSQLQAWRLGQWESFEHYLDLRVAAQAMYASVYAKFRGLAAQSCVRVDFYRKGHKLYEATHDGQALPLFDALGHLPWAFIIASEAGTFKRELEELYCFQPGCPEKAVSTYRLNFEYCRHGHKTEPSRPMLRRFCRRHLQRGDCGLEDADRNYEVLEGPGPGQAAGWEQDESRAAWGGVIDLSGAGE
jgi:hypothetical protein